MKKKSLLSVLLAVLLLCGAMAGILIPTEAESLNATVYYTIGAVEMEGSEHFDGIIPAFAAAQEKNHQWEANDVLEIRFKGEISAGAQDGLVFGQTTIWRKDGTKLPIIIRGVDTEKARDAYVYVDSAGGWYACANDFHFKNLTIPIADNDTEFYAGSGNISFENVYFKDQTVTINNLEESPPETTRSLFLRVTHGWS